MMKYCMGPEKYKVLRIDDPDFGCEGVPDSCSPQASVVLADKNGEQIVVRQDDDMLYKRQIEEGCTVCFDDENKLVCC